MDNGTYSSSTFRTEQIAEPPAVAVQDNLSAAIAATLPSTSNSDAANVPVQNYSYAAYQSSDSYGYGNTGYAGYYSGYQQQQQPLPPPPPPPQQQQSNQAYAQQVGAYQSTGAPQQPLSSFQNTVPYAGTANYSTTYYNPADYQTSGGYNVAGGYNNQNNSWQQGNYANYANQYPTYTPESNGAYNSSNPTTSSQYQQHYSQWADYYSQTEVSCAPGTENISASRTVNSVNTVPGVPGVPGGYPSTNSQQPAPYVSSWRPESSLPDLTPAQPSATISNAQDSYWKHGTPTFENQNVGHQSNLRTPLDKNPAYANYQDQRKPEYPQVSNAQYQVTHQVPQNYYASVQTVSPTVQQTVTQNVQQAVPQNVIPFDSRVSKLQIPTNPRIATNLSLGYPKTEKDNSVSSSAAKPVYISVAPPKVNEEVSSYVATDSILKPGMFPKSLRGYVERALSRCKDDKQMAACQDIMKEVITKATADGTLHTRDWDTEPLFPLPNTDRANNEGLPSLSPVSSLTKSRRSPSRRSKSRWEPLSVDKSVDKQDPVTPDMKYGGWFTPSEGEKFSTGKVSKESNWGNFKFTPSDPKAANRGYQRPAKKQCLGDGSSGADNGGASSDSDKEQSLTAYYSGAIALADTPEEKKRRESRSKRFEKARGNRPANNNSKPKTVGVGLYTRRANALVLRKNAEDANSRAVEDIDWDSLTVRGTCQEVEKRYLRLTSAPDPATVRPEDVLEKALLMVQSSQKNYLYKCDQLKSIRQDLTVQRIRNELTVKVYETHARLAIEVGDLSEYNQCQSQLQVLYAEGNHGCHMEFSAYNLLCVVHSNNNRDLLSAMSRLSVDARKDEAVKHALAVRAAVTSGNYVLFFRLYKEAPNLSTCLMDLYVEKMRYAAVKCMSRSYRPTLPVSYIAQVLGFSSTLSVEPNDDKDIDGLEECVEWLKAHGACLITDNPGEVLLDSKASASSLFMPEPEDAVAHGDASLAVNDFLQRAPS